jgi:hypothetical protein
MFTVGLVAENCFVFRRDGSDRALIVDPGDEAERILAPVEELGLTVEAILLTHTHFDHVGAVAPVAAATGAPVYCPKIEVPVLADIMSYVPWPGFGPFESYDADETVEGGERLALAGFDIDVHFVPGHSPGTSPTRSPTSRPCSRATCSFRARSGAPTCRAATGRRSPPRSRSCWTPSRRRPRCTRGTWA